MAQIFKLYKNYSRIWPEPFKTQLDQIISVSRSCLADKVNEFNDLLDMLPKHTAMTWTKCQFKLVMFGIATDTLTLATYNAVQISKLDDKINTNNQIVEHLIDITNLHKQHFKAVDQKVKVNATK